MTRRAIISMSLSALMLGSSLMGCAGAGGHIASAGGTAPEAAAGVAADRATRALARGHADEAVGFAEQAVAARPLQLDYRLLLARSYMKAGRLTSARQAFGDVLQLDPGNGKAALNLALAQIGLGDWADARATLDTHAATIPAADRGLATALAGDPVGAVEQLTAAARTPGADVKTRQNLALALALAGHWPEARAVAAADMSPADVDKRMTQWATFARPSGAADQLSALLGIVPVVDTGRPAVLALSAPAPIAPAAVEAVVPAPPAPAIAAIQPVPLAASEQIASASPVATTVVPASSVQQVPADDPEPTRAAPTPVKLPVAAHVTIARLAALPRAAGKWYVQIGAFRTAAVARDGWTRALRRDAALKDYAPEGATIEVRAARFYRLSVGGLSHAAAAITCRGYRARGGACFVRVAAGDQIASWAHKGAELASR